MTSAPAKTIDVTEPMTPKHTKTVDVMDPMTPERAASVVGVVLDENGEADAAAQLDRLLQRPGYRRHLIETCAATQEILLGQHDATQRFVAARILEVVAARHGVTLRFRAGTLDGAGTIVALLDARAALAPPRTRRALAGENRRRSHVDATLRKDEPCRSTFASPTGAEAGTVTRLRNALEARAEEAPDTDDAASASTVPLLRLDAPCGEVDAPPSSTLKPRKRERGCWCRG